MELSPKYYHRFVRPKWLTKKFIHNIILDDFDFRNKRVLDFGSGVGSNSTMFAPDQYQGYDIDPTRVDYARRFYPKYKFHVLNSRQFPIDDRSIDYILVIAVLHHVPTNELHGYLQEFRRVLKPYGKVLVLEPCYFHQSPINNWFMSAFDKGKYIQNEEGYREIFHTHQYQTKKLKQFKKMIFYNELFFSAAPKS